MLVNKEFTIIIADDHPMLLKGMFEELTNNNYNVIGQATNGMQALELLLTHNPTIAFLDIDMPLLNGFEVIKTAKEKGITTKFIVLSFHRGTEYITQAKALQINGYLLKEDSFFDIERSMEAVLNDREYFSRSFNESALMEASEEIKKLQFLTPSERTILKLIAQQTNNIDIAETLSISVRTVEKHRSNIIKKLDLDKETNTLTSWALVNKNTILSL